MPRGSKSSHSSKQKRQAAHIEGSYRRRGVGKKKAEERAWRTVNKRTGGAAKKGKSSRASGGRKTVATRARPATRRRTARSGARSPARARA